MSEKNYSLVIFTAITQAADTLNEKICTHNLEVDSVCKGRFAQVRGEIILLKSFEVFSMLSAVHLDKDLDGNWYPKFVDVIISKNNENIKEATVYYTSAKFVDGKKIPFVEDCQNVEKNRYVTKKAV